MPHLTRVQDHFTSHYARRVVEWEGVVLRVDTMDGDDELLALEHDNSTELVDVDNSTDAATKPLKEYKCQILVRMDPRFQLPGEALSENEPDLVLWMQD